MKTQASTAKRERGLTCAALDDAINVAITSMFEGSARETLESLYALTEGAAGTDAVRIDGPPPVTVTQFDEAVDAADLPARHRTAFNQLRPLLVAAQAQASKASNAPITRFEFEASQAANALALTVIADLLHDPTGGPLDKRLLAAVQSAEFESTSAAIKALLARIEESRKAEGQRQRRRASGRLHVANGAGGFNY